MHMLTACAIASEARSVLNASRNGCTTRCQRLMWLTTTGPTTFEQLTSVVWQLRVANSPHRRPWMQAMNSPSHRPGTAAAHWKEVDTAVALIN